MSAGATLACEPAAGWRRLPAAKHELFLADLERLMQERHQQFPEELTV